jgi:putative redox protein
MDERITFANPSGDALAGVLSIPERPNGKGVVLLHCFLCTKYHRIMRALCESLAAGGFTVLRFDFSGNGESGGRLEESTYSKMVGDVEAAVSLLQKRGITTVGLAGHSMGAMLSLLSAHADKRVVAVAFIAGSSAAARVREIFPPRVLEKVEKEGMADTFIYGRQIRINREFLHDLERYDVKPAAEELKRPLLIVHGTRDDVIPPYHAEDLYGWASEPKTLEWIEGADHLFSDDAHLRELAGRVRAWFAKNL